MIVRTRTDEVERLTRRCQQKEHALEQLSQAVTILKRGNEALRAENRELRLALERRQGSDAAALSSTR